MTTWESWWLTHSVTFKCIVITEDPCYQEGLVLAKQKIKNGEMVEVKLEKQTDDPYDANAVAFMGKTKSTWERIGYVVSEALPDVIEVITNQSTGSSLLFIKSWLVCRNTAMLKKIEVLIYLRNMSNIMYLGVAASHEM